MNIILFDGLCNLCNSSVKFVIKNDQQAKFKFASLQSKQGQRILKNLDLINNTPETFVYIKNNAIYIKSTAALKVMKELGWPCRLFYILILIPTPVRDFVYDVIARMRYRIFGKKESCMIPQFEYQNRFID